MARRPSWRHEEAFRRIAAVINRVEAGTHKPVTRSKIADELAHDVYVLEAAEKQDRSVEDVAKNMVD